MDLRKKSGLFCLKDFNDSGIFYLAEIDISRTALTIGR